MGAAPRNAAVPSSLRPRAPDTMSDSRNVSNATQETIPPLHLALVVPDERIQKLLADHCYVIGPTTRRMRVTVHAVLADKQHMAAGLDAFMRWALVETGLLPPEEVGLVTKAQMELGWATHTTDTEA